MQYDDVDLEMIACLGWGSLVWCQKYLPVEGDWKSDGPDLAVEFARQSKDNRITLVICHGSPTVSVLWATLKVKTIAEAVKSLAIRESISPRNASYSIGHWTPEESSGHIECETISKWALERNIDGVVWTALKPMISGTYRTPSKQEVICHLKGLSGLEKIIAEEYVRLAPRQIETPYRKQIQADLGWHPFGN